jgi:hypothetical protein
MKIFTFIHAALATALIGSTLTACGDDGSGETTDPGTETTDPGTDPSGTTFEPPTTEVDPTSDDTTTTTTTDPPPTTTTTTDPTTTNPVETTTTTEPPDTTTTTGETTTSTDTSTSSTSETTDTDTDSTTGDPVDFVFMDLEFDAYTQIDRHGAVEAGTAGIKASQGLGFPPNMDIGIRDDYNASNPVEDAAGMWVPEILDSIMFFHGALDDDIMGLGLMPATVQESVDQAGPVIIPDTIKFDPGQPTAYPNGRTLTDPVVDITLAAVLLKLGGNQPLSTFADVPVNPPANDVPFASEFPYLAPPHL